MGNQSNREIEIFNSALERATLTERAAYLDGACGGDAELRTRIEALIRAHELAGGFLPAEDAKQQATELAKTFAMTTGLFPITEKPGDRIGRYKLLQQIGEGGCGVVYMAEQQEPVRRKVALKVIKLGMDTKSVIARFEAERQALALMDHPNIAKVLDAGATETGRPYFVMELVHGTRITDYCDENNLDIRTRLDLFIQVCQAVQHAHQKGIIHRDIKPSNILVTLRDGVPVPKVIDFGIAKATTDQRLTDKTVFTAFEQFMGTPAYMSPEQAEMSEQGVDTRSDIYSLGILLYELLTGGTPFDAKQLLQSGLDAMRKTIREIEPPRPSTKLSTMLDADLTAVAQRHSAESPKLIHLIRGDLDWIVMKSLEKDRTRRYETANGLAADIKRHLNSEPVVACPPSNLYRLQKLVRRNKLTVTAAGAVVVSLVLGLVFSSLEVIRATRSERSGRGARIAAEQARTRESASEQRARSLLYAADMRLVQQAWDEGNLSRMTSLLDTHRPKPGETDERGFEYFYFQNLAKGEQEQVLYHATNAVLNVAISPDGKWLASRTVTEVRLWDLASRSLVAAFAATVTNRENLTLGPFDLGTSFSHDSQYLSIVTQTGLQIVHISTRQIRNLFNGPVDWAAFSPVTNLIAFNVRPIGENNPNIEGARIWDYVANQEVSKPGTGNPFCWSPDGKHLLTGRGYFDLETWDTVTWSRAHSKNIGSLLISAVVSSRGGLMAAADWQGKIHLMEMAGTDEIGTLLSGDVRGGALAFSPDGKWLATGSDSQVIQIWDVATRQRIRQLRGHQGKIVRLAFTPDGRTLASADTDGEVRLWNPARPTGDLQITNEIKGWGGIPPQFSPDGKWLGICTNLRDSLLVDASSLQASAAIDGWIISFSPDAREFATMNFDPKLHVRRIGASSNRASIYLDTIPARFSPQQISSDGTVVALGNENGLGYRIKLFEAASGAHLISPAGAAAGNITSHFLADGRRVISTDGSKINIWDMQSHTNTRSLECAAEVYFFAVSPDEKQLAASHPDGTISLWDLTSGTQVGILVGHKANVFSLAFSSDGRTLASGSEDRTIKLWHLATQRELASFAEESGVYWLTFSPDNQMLVSGGRGSYQFRRAPRDGAAVLPSLPKLSMADLPTNSIWRVPDGPDQVPPRVVADQDQCFTNLVKIHAAIMAYRKDHQQMPDWLNDLVPKYLSDTNCLVCPVCARIGEKPNLYGLDDPKQTSSYIYLFSAHANIFPDEYGIALPGDTLKVWKEKQLLRYGPIVPVVGCVMHSHFLGITFGGERRFSDENWQEAFEQDPCFTNMFKIYAAIMAYRKDHQQMPDWLSDLVPKYLSDTNCLICPVCALTGRKPDLNGMDDPKLTSSYFYEFSAHTNVWPDPYGVASPGDTMKEWKQKQLLHYGPVVPVVRCAMHPRYLSVTFDGKRRLDPDGSWEKVEELKLKQGTATNAVPATR